MKFLDLAKFSTQSLRNSFQEIVQPGLVSLVYSLETGQPDFKSRVSWWRIFTVVLNVSAKFE